MYDKYTDATSLNIYAKLEVTHCQCDVPYVVSQPVTCLLTGDTTSVTYTCILSDDTISEVHACQAVTQPEFIHVFQLSSSVVQWWTNQGYTYIQNG